MTFDPKANCAMTAALFVTVVGLLTIGGFFFFQYVLGYPPCPLCLDQRKAFYVAVPLAALLIVGASSGASRKVLMLGFLAIALVMLWNTGLSAFHAGVEWKFWQGPTACTGNGTSLDLNQLSNLNAVKVVQCDQIQWQFLGISLAGYNALVSALIVLLLALALINQMQRGRQVAAA